MRVVPFITFMACQQITNLVDAATERQDRGATNLRVLRFRDSCTNEVPHAFNRFGRCDRECLDTVSECVSHPTVAGKYHCECTDGYEGTAGLGHCEDNCKDINECQLTASVLAVINKTPCSGPNDFLCVNTVGHYGCVDACGEITNDSTMDANYGNECRGGYMTTQCEVMNRMATADYESLFGDVACSGEKFLCVDLEGGGYNCVDPCAQLATNPSATYSCVSGSTGICDVMQGMGGDFQTEFGLDTCQCDSSSRGGGYTCTACDAGKVWDTAANSCVCEAGCPNSVDQVQDPATCSCSCMITPDCGISNGSYQTKRVLENCKCKCPADTSCDPGWTYNAEECACEKDLEVTMCAAVMCDEGKLQNPATCQCETPAMCAMVVCAKGKERNVFTCQCEDCQNTCVPPQVRAEFGCGCE